MPSEQELKWLAKSLQKRPVWRPGDVVVADLERFRSLVAEGYEGELAGFAYMKFKNNFRDLGPAKARQLYLGPSLLAPKHAEQFLGTAKKEHEVVQQDNKKLTFECSSFSYSAVATLMLDDNVRENYDILQIGTMRMDQGLGVTRSGERGKSYAHNIAVLMPKGKGLSQDGKLPEGALIVDPWARALGHTKESTILVTPEKFIFKTSLYPLMVNYNSAKDDTVEEAIATFKQENPDISSDLEWVEEEDEELEDAPLGAYVDSYSDSDDDAPLRAYPDSDSDSDDDLDAQIEALNVQSSDLLHQLSDATTNCASSLTDSLSQLNRSDENKPS
jgi:RavJ, Peptidase domain